MYICIYEVIVDITYAINIKPLEVDNPAVWSIIRRALGPSACVIIYCSFVF